MAAVAAIYVAGAYLAVAVPIAILVNLFGFRDRVANIRGLESARTHRVWFSVVAFLVIAVGWGVLTGAAKTSPPPQSAPVAAVVVSPTAINTAASVVTPVPQPSPVRQASVAPPSTATLQLSPTALHVAPTAAAPTAIVVPPSPTQVAYGTKDNPVPAGVYYTLQDHSAHLQIRVIEVIKNAKTQVHDANSFNQVPPSGNDYILVKLEARYFQGDDNKPYRTSAGENRFLAQSQLWGAPMLSVAPAPSFEGNDIFPGAVVTGWLPGKYLPVDAIDSAVLQYGGIYFTLGKQGSSAPAQKLEPLPTPDPAMVASAPLGSRFHPIPLGSTATITDKGQKLEIKVNQAVQDATKQVKDANMFNSDPPSGYTYLLVRLGLKYVQASGSDAYKTSDSVRFYAGNELWGGPFASVAPQPTFGGRDIFVEANVDGWLAGKYVPKDLAPKALLLYGDTYFALQK